MIDVLLVEDDPVTGYALAELLSRDGYRVEIASDFGRAASLASRRHGAAILDLMLPGGSGEDLIGLILRANPDCRVLVCTGAAMTPGREAAIRAKGAAGVMSKPVDFRDLMANLSGGGA